MELTGVREKAETLWVFLKKHAFLIALLTVLILQFVPNGNGTYPWGGIWMRMQVKDLPMAESAAASSVENYITNQVNTEVQQKYPNLPEENRKKVADDLKKKIKEENKDQFASETKRLAQEVRNQYSYEENNQTFLYMPDIDPYFYLRYARNIVEKGHVYDELKDGKPWDNHMIAPIGAPADQTWHAPMLALIYRIHSTFDKSTTLMNSACYFPIIFIFLSLIFTFFVAYRISGPVGGVFATTILAILPAVMGRTPWGHADTDAYNIFFPILIIWLLFEALSAKTTKKQAIFGGLTGLAFVCFAKFWMGWWYLIDFVGAAFAIAIIADIIMNSALLKQGFNHFWQHSQTKKFAIIGISLFVAGAIFSTFTIGFTNFFPGPIITAIQSTALKEATAPGLWPNTLTTVAELNPGSIAATINSVGGKAVFLIGILGIILLLLRKDEKGKYDLTYSALLAIWFLGTMYMAIKGTRFILLIGPAFAIAFGAGAGIIYQKVSVIAEKHLRVHKIITGVLIIAVIAIIIINPAKAGVHMAKDSYNSVINDVPLVNDAWWNALTKIKDNSQPNAIINSWWDFGHHFKYIADRAVSFDGASQTLPHAHWVGRVLQTDNEDEAIAILRMLDCGAHTSYDVALETLKDPLTTTDFIKSIIMMDKETARQAVKKAGVPEKVLELTHCNPPEDFFIASGDMVSKSGVWAHFGLWNFDKAEMWIKWRLMDEKTAIPKMAERFNITEDAAKKLYKEANNLDTEEAANAWISPWPHYVMQDPASCSTEGELLKCGSITINMTDGQASLRTNQGTGNLNKVIIYDKKGNKKVHETQGGNNVVAILWPTASGMNAIAAFPELADSIFTRLYYMGGLGLKHFKPFDTQSQIFGAGMIYTYKIDWESNESYIPPELMPKEKVEPGAQVTFNYIGWTEEGIFDSSITNWKEQNITQYDTFENFETKPMTFVAGKSMIIPGLESRVTGMKPGETKTVTIPPEEAYGTNPVTHELGNKTLNFKIQIKTVQ